MNMPVARDGTVHFSTTLLALVRESLDIKMAPGKLQFARLAYTTAQTYAAFTPAAVCILLQLLGPCLPLFLFTLTIDKLKMKYEHPWHPVMCHLANDSRHNVIFDYFPLTVQYKKKITTFKK